MKKNFSILLLLFLFTFLIASNINSQGAKRSTSRSKLPLQKAGGPKFLKFTWLDLDFMHFYPIPDTRLADFTDVNYGGGVRVNFMLLGIKRLWLFASLLADDNETNTHRMETLADYSLAAGAGWRFPLSKRFFFTPKFSYGIMLHSTYGDYYNDAAIYPNDSRSGEIKQRYFTDTYMHIELEFAYSISPFFNRVDGEIFLSPSFIFYPEQHRPGLEAGYLVGVRMKYNSNSVIRKTVSTFLGGKVVDSRTGKTIDYILPAISDANPPKIKTITGETFAYRVEPGKKYTFIINNEEFKPFKYTVSGKRIEEGKRANVVLPLVRLPSWGITGTVLLKKTRVPIEKVKVYVTWKDDKNKDMFTNVKGDFRMRLDKETDYDILLKKRGYFTVRADFTSKGKSPGWYNIMRLMNTPIQKAKVGATVEFGNVLFDTGKWNITTTGAKVLNKMVQFLNDNPTLHVELGAHTDSQGKAKANQILSQKRAQSAVDYMITNGIRDNRIVAKGYGETKLVNKCSDGVRCLPQQHQANRRIDLTVLKL